MQIIRKVCLLVYWNIWEWTTGNSVKTSLFTSYDLEIKEVT